MNIIFYSIHYLLNRHIFIHFAISATKRGKKGELQISYNSQFGIQSLKTDMELMNASQFVTYMNEAGISSVVDNG